MMKLPSFKAIDRSCFSAGIDSGSNIIHVSSLFSFN